MALSACSLGTDSSTGFGAASTRSFASLSPRLVRARTSLMTWIFLSPAAVSTTLNSVCSSASSAAAPPAAGPPATATGAAAWMPNSSSIFFDRSAASMTDSSLIASRMSSTDSFAMTGLLSC